MENLIDDKLLVTMDISVCMERAGPCEVILNVFKDTRLPKPVCNWKTDFVISGMGFPLVSIVVTIATKSLTHFVEK